MIKSNRVIYYGKKFLVFLLSVLILSAVVFMCLAWHLEIRWYLIMESEQKK